MGAAGTCLQRVNIESLAKGKHARPLLRVYIGRFGLLLFELTAKLEPANFAPPSQELHLLVASCPALRLPRESLLGLFGSELESTLGGDSKVLPIPTGAHDALVRMAL